ncbi:MAG: FHA domain-containing protein [Bacteriovoracia bacterium]
MFKLIVVSGPARGASYSLREGENTVGRMNDNSIVLSSTNVSKKHCVLVVDNKNVSVKDVGSSNGTFVNGVLTRLKKLIPGDKVSVGDFVFQLVAIEQKKPAAKPQLQVVPPMQAPMNMGIQGLPTGNTLAGFGAQANAGQNQSVPNAPALPTDIKGKLKYYFEQYIINFLYNLNEKHEWRVLAGAMAALLMIGSVLVSVAPTMQRTTEKLEQESRYRAALIARQMVDRNSQFIYERLESKVDIGFAEKEEGVIAAFVVDMEGRIIAPGRDFNKYITEPDQASFSAIARNLYNTTDRTIHAVKMFPDVVAVAEPVRVFNQAAGKNTTVALALVYFDRNKLLFDPGSQALAYITAFIFAAILFVLIFFSLYKLTLKPLTSINEEIDQVLKGNSTSGTIERKFKFEELDSLVEITNAALQRALTGTGGMGSNSFEQAQNLGDEVVSGLKFMAEKMTGTGIIIFGSDKKIQFVNSTMEEITGIRSDGAIGTDINTSARDSAFVALVDDLTARTASGGNIQEDFEFSGVAYKMECLGVGSPARAYLLSATKVES